MSRLVPRGTSAYQAAWILDDYGDGADGVPDDDLVPLGEEEKRLNPPPQGRRSMVRRMFGDTKKRSKKNKGRYDDLDSFDDDDDDDDDDVEGDDDADVDDKMTDGDDGDDDDGLDLDDDDSIGAPDQDDDEGLTLLQRLDKRAEEEVMFPDEVDCRPGEKAREIFRGWRGLQSFRDTPWDKYENLPPEYARVYQFASFRRTMEALQREAHTKPVPAGSFVRLIVRVPLRARVSSTTHCELAAERQSAAPAAVVSGSDGSQPSALPTAVGGDASSAATNRGEYHAAPDRRVPLLLALVHELLESSAPVTPLTPAPRPFVVSGLFKHEHKLSVMHWYAPKYLLYFIEGFFNYIFLTFFVFVFGFAFAAL